MVITARKTHPITKHRSAIRTKDTCLVEASLLHCMKSQIRNAKSEMTLLSVAQTQTKRGVPSYDEARRLKSRKGQ